MHTRHALTISLLALGTAVFGCASGGSDTDHTTDTPNGGTGGTGGSTGGGGSGATGGNTPDPCVATAGHLLISEVSTQPAGNEFIELWNPGSSAVDLTPYYLSDNSAYYRIAAGEPWTPDETPGTDYLAQFPPSTSIGPGEWIVIQAGSGDFGVAYPGSCPDFVLAASPATCGAAQIPTMRVPENGGIGTSAGSLVSNDREMVMLFCWGGGNAPLHDVDYVTWGTEFEDATRVDKTAVAGYLPDTPRASQKPALAPGPLQSISRCNAAEASETTSGGNGLSGHDETSEDFGAAFELLCEASPGDNDCSAAGGCGGGGA